MERFPNAFGHGILLSLMELLSPRIPPRSLLVWMVESETELWKPPCLHCLHFVYANMVLSLYLGGLVHWGVYMSLDRAEWGSQAPRTPAFIEALSTLCTLPVTQEGTTSDKRAILGHQGHQHVWGMLPGSGDILSMRGEWEKSKGTRKEATKAAPGPLGLRLGKAREGYTCWWWSL